VWWSAVGWFSGLGSDESGHAASGSLRRHPHVPGEVDSAHSCALGVGGNRGIMRNSTVGSGRGSAPMCADPPHRAWEPDHHTRRPQEKTVIPTKTSPRLAEPLVSHVQHRGQPHPSGAPTTFRTEIGLLPARDRSDSAGPTRRRGAHDELESESRMPHLRTAGEQHARGTGPISTRKHDRFRAGTRPISARSTTDFGTEYNRSRAGERPISTKGEARGVHRSADTAVARPVVAGFVPRS